MPEYFSQAQRENQEGANSLQIAIAEAQARAAAETAAKAEEMKRQGLNLDGSPIRPDWQSLIDPATGQLQSRYVLNVDKYDPMSSLGYKKFQQEALRTGPSEWANLMLQKQQLEEQNLRSQAARQSQAAMNQGFGQLAMRGGLSTGSRNRLAASGMRDLLAARQQATRQGLDQRLGIGTTDEEKRQQQLLQLTNADVDIGKYNTTLGAKQSEFNLQNLLKEEEGKRSFTMGTYQEQMKKWAADKQAQATANSGGGGK
jgi:hypothetical protein